MEMSRVLVVIVNYRNAAESLQAVDGALRALDGMAGSITVVDGGSGDNSARSISAEIAARGQDGRVRVLEGGSTANIAGGKNVGICAGLPDGQVPDYIYILDPRARPAADTIRKLIAHLNAHPRTGIVGGGAFGPDGAGVANAFRFPSILTEFSDAARLGIAPRPFPKAGGPVDWVTDTSMMLRRKALDDTGLFDEDYGVLFDSTDLCRRARASGWATDYVGESRVDLLGTPETIDVIRHRRTGTWMDARLRYFLKNHGRVHAAAATVARVTGGLIRRLGGRRYRIDPPRFLRDLVLHDLGVALRSIWASLRSITSVQPAPAPRRARRR